MNTYSVVLLPVIARTGETACQRVNTASRIRTYRLGFTGPVALLLVFLAIQYYIVVYIGTCITKFVRVRLAQWLSIGVITLENKKMKKYITRSTFDCAEVWVYFRSVQCRPSHILPSCVLIQSLLSHTLNPVRLLKKKLLHFAIYIVHIILYLLKWKFKYLINYSCISYILNLPKY